MEAPGFSRDIIVDAIKQVTKVLGTDRPHVPRGTILAVRKGGKVSVPGVYSQTHVQRYLPQLLQLILENRIDTSDLISHRLPLEQAPEGYKNFKENQNEWTKVVQNPTNSGAASGSRGPPVQ